MSKELLAEARTLAEDVEKMSDRLVTEYGKFCDTVRTNGLQRLHGKNWQTTFEIPDSTAWITWRPDTDDRTDIGLADSDDTWWMPAAYLEDPEAWLQGALAAHGQAAADNAATASQRRSARKAELRRQLEALEAQGDV